MNPDADNLERLLSERSDGTLSEREAAAVDRAMASDAKATRDARAYERLASLLAGWRTLPEGIDWEQHAAEIGDRVSMETSTDRVDSASRDRALDALVRGQGKPLPPVDWDGLKHRISAAVHEEAASRRSAAAPASRRRVGWLRWAAVGSPLAAAAVVLLAIWWPGRMTPVPRRVSPVGEGSLIAVSVEQPEQTGRVMVSFLETPVIAASDEDEGPGGYAYARGPGRGEFVEPGMGGVF